jgi:hypothetical protein
MKHDYTLITNIDRVRRKGDELLMSCFAILLSDVKSGVCKGASIRGFYPDPAAPVFNLHLDAAKVWPYKLDFIPPSIDPGWTCYGIYELTFADGTAFTLYTLDATRPIYTADYSGDIYKVWADLRDKVASYWDRPNMPVVDYLPPSIVLRMDNMYRRRLDEERKRT